MKRTLRALVIVLVAALSLGMLACASKTGTPAPGPGGGLVVQSDSLITGQLKAIRQQTTGYPWSVDVLVQTSDNVGSLPNPTADKVGQVITTQTDQDMSAFKVGDSITANVKYVGDVPKPGIILYLYNVKPNT